MYLSKEAIQKKLREMAGLADRADNLRPSSGEELLIAVYLAWGTIEEKIICRKNKIRFGEMLSCDEGAPTSPSV